MTRVGAIAALVSATLATTQPVAAATSLILTPASGPVGTSVAAAANGFSAEPVVTFWWDNSVFLGTDNAGSVRRLTFNVPTGAVLGPHTVRACASSFCPESSPIAHADATFTVTLVVATPKPTPPPTPKPTPRSTPTPRPTATPRPTHAPTQAASPTPTLPTPTSPAPPIGTFPIGAPTPVPTPMPLVVVTPAPKPPDDLAIPETTFPNVLVRDIEVTQGIQNLANEMPLVTGRRTYARVYVGLQGADSWPNTYGALEARRGGQQIGWIWPENGPIIARPDGGDRTRVDDTLNFRLPASWTSGSVTLTAFVFSYMVETPFTKEPQSADNFDAVSVHFNDGQPLTIHLAPLHLHRSYHRSDVERVYSSDIGGDLLLPGSNAGSTDRIIQGLFRYLPLATLNVDTLNAPITPLGHANGHEFDLGGICKTTLREYGNAHLVIDDWTILVEDPNPQQSPNAWLTPDRDTLRIMDRTWTISGFYPREDGSGDVYGSDDGVGPEPIPGAPVYAYSCLIIVPELHEPNDTLALYRVFYDWADERELFVGMIDPSMKAAFSGGIASNGTDAVSIRMTDSFDGQWPWWHSGAETIGHEAAHQAGLGHVPCSDDDGDGVPDELAGGGLDLTHPMTLTFPDCHLSELDPRGYYGFDVYWDRFGLEGPSAISNDPSAPPPARAYPLLGYEFPGWVDPFHYCRMLTYYGVPCSATALDLPWNPPPPEPDGSEPFAFGTPPPAEPLAPGVDAATVLLTESEDGEWTIRLLARNSSPTDEQLQRIVAEKRLPADPDRPRLSVLGPDGAPTWEVTVPRPELPHDADSVGFFQMRMVVPLPPDASGIEVRGWNPKDKKAQLDASDDGPAITDVAIASSGTCGTVVGDGSVRFISYSIGPPAPDSSAPDNSAPAVVVLYAPDGSHWQVVATDSGSGRRCVPVQVAGLASGDEPKFRLVAFDGWNTTEAEMGAPDLAAPRNPPTVLIFADSPRRYPANGTVRLEATAFDLEDRAIPGDAIEWSSSLDGQVGRGSELVTRDLTAGSHLITATARDSDGLIGSATYVLDVDGDVVQTLPRPETEAAIGRIFERLAAGQDPAPPLGAGGGSQGAWIAILAAALAIVAITVIALGRSSTWIRLSTTWSGRGAGAGSGPGTGGNETVTVHGGQTEAPPSEASEPTVSDIPITKSSD